MSSKKKDFTKIDDFQVFLVLVVLWLDFELSQKLFVWYCSGQLKHHKCYDYMKTALLKELFYLALADMVKKMIDAVGLGED